MAYDATDFVVTETPVPVAAQPGRIRLLRDTIALHNAFNMENPIQRECGAPACFYGYANFIFKLPKSNTRATGEFLGLTPEQSYELFGMTVAGVDFHHIDRNWNANASQACALLDNYLATGQIDWSVA